MSHFKSNFQLLALSILLAVCSAVAFATPEQSQEISEPLTLAGTLTVLIADDFTHHRTKTSYAIGTSPGHQVELTFKGAPPANLHTGMMVRASGQFNGRRLLVDQSPKAFAVSADPSAVTSQLKHPGVTHKTLIVLADIADGTGAINEVSKSCDGTSDVSVAQMFGDAGRGESVNGVFRESSFGKEGFAGVGSVGTALDVVRVMINEAAALATVCNAQAWADAADSAAVAAGVPFAEYQNRVYILPAKVGCRWGALSQLSCGSDCRMWQKTYAAPAQCGYIGALAHGLGHNLGFTHSATDTDNDGVVESEFGDASDLMGDAHSALRQVNGPHKLQPGWIANSAVVDGSSGGLFTLSALELSQPAYPQVMKVTPLVGLPYYLSYRTPTAYDTAVPTEYLNRTNIHRWAGGNTNTLFLRALADGQSFNDAANGLTVTQRSHDAQTATFQVATAVPLTIPALTIADVSVSEGHSGTKLATFTVKLSTASASPVTYDIATSNWTAAAGSDYVASNLIGQSIAPGDTSKTFVVTINGDAAIESDEYFKVTASNVVGSSIFDGVATGAILNDETVLSIADVSISEGNSGTKLAKFTVQLSPALSPLVSPVTYDIATSNGTAAAGIDYVASSLVGQSISSANTFSVTINGDVAVEANETFNVNVTSIVGATVSDGMAVGTITNDDGPMLSIADVLVSEGHSGTKLATFTVKLSEASASPVTYDIATSNWTAAAGTDYVASNLIGQSIAAGDTSKTFVVTINGDAAIEATEYFKVTASNVVGVPVFDGVAAGTIFNDDSVLSISDVSIVEGNSGTKLAIFTVQLSPNLNISATPVSYNIATSNGTATAGTDYVASSLVGQSVRYTNKFSVTINGDAAVEANEAFNVHVTGVVGATVSDGVGVGTILNEDGPMLSIADVIVSEGHSGTKLATFTVTLSEASASPVTYDIATSNWTAAAGTDYVASNLIGQSIAAGDTSKTFVVLINGDAAIESDEFIKVTASNVVGVPVFDGVATGTILNDDSALSIVADVSIVEGNSGTKLAIFTVQLSPSLSAAATPVTYNIATSNGTAAAGTDYVASSLVGQSVRSTNTFSVTINGDATGEANETFNVNVTGVVGATVTDGVAVGTILNDEGISALRLRN